MNIDLLLEETLELAQKLIQTESISPEDGGLNEFIAQYLEQIDFCIEHINIGNVLNLYAKIGPGPYLCFAGHVDVVPPGSGWKHINPYSGIIENGYLYGRGANDMKTTIACAMVVFKYLLREQTLSLAMLLTSDEEDLAEDGLKKVVPQFIERNEQIKLFILGEPTARKIVGDTVKIGRRGSITAIAKIMGIQGHIAYPEFALNPIPIAAKIAQELQELDFNDMHPYFGKTKLQMTNLNAFNQTTNVIPGMVELRFGTRFNIYQTEESIKQKVQAIFHKHCKMPASYEIAWHFHGAPFICDNALLLENLSKIISPIIGQKVNFDAKGATSDGRFLSKIAPVFEIGFQEDMAHKVDECVAVDDIKNILNIYYQLFQNLVY